MSISREDFLRLLPGAVEQVRYDEASGCFHGGGRGRSWTLRLQPLPDRRLGSVVLPRHQVELQFADYSEVEIETFMVRFHRAFQRGGG